MTQPLTTGEKSRRANLRQLKAQGRKNAIARRAAASDNVETHLAAMAERKLQAATARAARRLMGMSRRDAHNSALRAEAEARRAASAPAPVIANDNEGELPLAG